MTLIEIYICCVLGVSGLYMLPKKYPGTDFGCVIFSFYTTSLCLISVFMFIFTDLIYVFCFERDGRPKCWI